MDRDRLERYLEEGLSLEAIGLLENCDPSTVSYWVRKLGLKPNGQTKHAARGTVGKEVLHSLVDEGLTIAQIAARVDRSPAGARYWLAKYGLKTKSRRGAKPIVPRELVEEARSRGQRTLEAECPAHGPTVFVIQACGKVICRACRMARVSARRRKNKEELAQEAGGKCMRCGYDDFLGALQFHHLNPEEKRFGLAQNGSTMSLDALREEAKKCVLLCANCHAEVEHGGGELPLQFE